MYIKTHYFGHYNFYIIIQIDGIKGMQIKIPELSLKIIIVIMNPSGLQLSSIIITLNLRLMVINIKN